MTKDLLPTLIQDIFRGLQDVDDDVRAVAASALVPIADDFVTVLPQQVHYCYFIWIASVLDWLCNSNHFSTLHYCSVGGTPYLTLIFVTLLYCTVLQKSCLKTMIIRYEPEHEKTNNLGFRPGLTQTRLYRHRI